MKNILDKMNEFGKHHEGLLSLLPISITIAGILLKVGFTLFITGMNYYNSMPLSLNIPFMADALTQIFIFIGIAIGKVNLHDVFRIRSFYLKCSS